MWVWGWAGGVSWLLLTFMLGRRGEESGTIEGLGGWQWKKEECHVEVELRWWLNANAFFVPAETSQLLEGSKYRFIFFRSGYPTFSCRAYDQCIYLPGACKVSRAVVQRLFFFLPCSAFACEWMLVGK